MSTAHHPPHEAVAGTRGVASSAHPYATQAALQVLERGGSAVDAAIAAGAVLTVVMPWAGQLGGDCFFLVSDPDGTVSAVNGSGAAPHAATLEKYRECGEIPTSGWWASTVPGMVHGWETAHNRWGRTDWSQLFDAAAHYASNGAVMTGSLQARITGNAEQWSTFPETAGIFLLGGSPPAIGSVFKQPDLGRTIQAIAEGGASAFYSGEIARKIVESSRADGGLFSEDDLGSHTTPAPPPISISYQGTTVYEQPPVTQGIVLLMALGTLDEAGYSHHAAGSADSVHLQVEATKFGFLDRLAHLGDPDHVSVPVDDMLSGRANRHRAAAIDLRQRSDQFGQLPAHADTTSLVVADGEGRVVTYIHSLYTGSGVVVPGTGIMMNSRLLGFSLDPDSPNALAPGKRPVHTLNAVMIQKGSDVYGICTPGANLQVQHNLQVLTNLLDHDMEMQAAVDAPRWSMGDQLEIGDPALQIEDRFGEEVLADLESRGHTVKRAPGWAVGGGIQVVRADRNQGTLWAARDPRRATNLASAL
jgi:gamma-glutamyltranspeptidase / glutathione hydrolase